MREKRKQNHNPTLEAETVVALSKAALISLLPQEQGRDMQYTRGEAHQIPRSAPIGTWPGRRLA